MPLERKLAIPKVLLACLLCLCSAGAAEFQSDFQNTNDRVWVGAQYWANPMEDWRVEGGELQCIHGGSNRNVHVLTYALGSKPKGFEISVNVKLIDKGKRAGSAGFRVGAKDEIDDYRAAALRGQGLDAGVTSDGKLFLGKKQIAIDSPADSGTLRLVGTPTENGKYTLSLEFLAGSQDSRKEVSVLTAKNVAARQLAGNIALSHNAHPDAAKAGGARFSFRDWRIRGEKVESHPGRTFGPILWAMHTLSRSKEHGYVLKITAQMPPIGEKDPQLVALELQEKESGVWDKAGSTKIDPLSRTATFRIAGSKEASKWLTGGADVPYRLTYDGHQYTGTVRRDPVDKPALVVAGFTGNQDYVFPNLEIAKNVAHQNPDVLFFSGDQIYENVGGYGIVREPVDRAVLNYLRKWYLLGWAFGDLMRDRVTVCLPDDHDVYQGNIWGEAGVKMRQGGSTSSDGGYREPADFVNAVHRTQTSHHPDLYDPTPVKQGITVFYGPMLYGRVSFAIIADRQFKSGPYNVADWKGRADHLKDPNYDVSKLDQPGLELLGKRQEKFLNEWAADWFGADFKCVLSQTIFCNLANYHGGNQEFIIADLDSNGWPQSGRNRALRAMRKGFAFHYAGDQHLPSIVHHGIDQFGDSGWSFCVPSIAAGYPRAWRPDEEGRPVRNRVNGPNTGDYLDGFGNKMTVWAVGNPAEKNRPGRVLTAHDKSSGFGIVRFNHADRTIKIECWRLGIDAANPMPGDQFPGWPKTIKMTDNYARKATAYLPTIKIAGLTDPVVTVIDEANGELVYALRIKGSSFRPKVFHDGKYTVRVAQPEKDLMKVLSNLSSLPKDERKSLEVRFP